jgi:hypothetical protein
VNEEAPSGENSVELAACTPHPVNLGDFNPAAMLPYGLTIRHIHQAMTDFVEFLGFINRQLYTKEIPRFEMLLMPANFSSVVGEFMSTSIPKYCLTLAKNRYHNGHPDLIPVGRFPQNAVQHAAEGIEIKSSPMGAGGKVITLNMSGSWCLCSTAIARRMPRPGCHPGHFASSKWWAHN